jgi:hypothetical protein
MITDPGRRHTLGLIDEQYRHNNTRRQKKKKHGATNKDSRKMSGPTTKTRNQTGYIDKMTFLDLRVAGEGTHVDGG